jgi:nitrogenase-associated protein
MAEVWFYEKPGCINNTKQKQLLLQSGHDVISHNLLETDWDVVKLRAFFGDLPVSEWFNYTAPAIKDGCIDPTVLDEEQALDLLISAPILIRRPLMNIGAEYMVGFDIDVVDKWIGLASNDIDTKRDVDLENCPRQR